MSLYVGSFLGLFIILGAHFYAENILSAHRYNKTLLSVIAGIAIAYAFIDVFPHLARKQPILENLYWGPVSAYLANHVYLLALLGFCVYVGIRVFSATRVKQQHSHIAYIALVVSMSLYAMLAGYMLAEQSLYQPETAFLFALAMAAHFLGLHHELMTERTLEYNYKVRYVLMGFTVLGWLGSTFYTIPQPVYALGFAYIAGGIVAAGAINDLPRVKSSSTFRAFLAGVLFYSALLLVIEALRKQI